MYFSCPGLCRGLWAIFIIYKQTKKSQGPLPADLQAGILRLSARSFCHFHSMRVKGIEKSDSPMTYWLFLLNQVTNNLLNKL